MQQAELQRQLDGAAAAREELQAARFARLSHALATVNRHLGRVYGDLTAGAGDAVLSYTPDRQLMFLHGASLEVR